MDTKRINEATPALQQVLTLLRDMVPTGTDHLIGMRLDDKTGETFWYASFLMPNSDTDDSNPPTPYEGIGETIFEAMFHAIAAYNEMR